MLSEYITGIDGSLKLLCVVLFGLFYWLGGRHWKWQRRFIAPLFLVGYCFWALRDWRVLLMYPLYAGALHLGYGVNSKFMRLFNNKMLTRAICGLSIVSASLPLVLLTGSWILFFVQVVLVVPAAVFGAHSIINAAQEELVIATLTTCLIPWMI